MKPNIWNTSTAPSILDEVRSFERLNGLKLPAEYVRFLLEKNGGRPERPNFKVPGWPGQASMVGDFYGLRPGEICSLQYWFTEFRDTLPPGFLAIADDPGGNLICIATLGAEGGKIYYWDPTPDWDLSEQTGNLFRVADTFDQFLEQLT
jgi:hypothetical protein